MISDENLRFIAELFNGDLDSVFSYKKGSDLIAFFNQYFGYKEHYTGFKDKNGQGFPSRWIFTYNKFVELINSNHFDKFINIILGKNYLMREQQIDEVSAIHKSQEIQIVINNKLKSDRCSIVRKSGLFFLVNEDDDLVLIGSGGFAEVYKRKSNGCIVKKLKDDFITDAGIRSRFKREYTITKSLNDIQGIIRVFDYYESNCSYSMEEAEQTLYDYIINNTLPENNKITCIRQILNIMKIVHERDIIHRDLSPNNVLVLSGMLKISDFGLGKDLNIFNSHQTLFTNSVGQYYYCAPEQFMMLKDGDKRSDVYSLGRIINFLFSEDPTNCHHFLRSVTEKATSQNPAFRYADAAELLSATEKSILYNENFENKENVLKKARAGVFDEDVEKLLYELSGEELCKVIINRRSIVNIVFRFMQQSEERAMYIIGAIEENYQKTCSNFVDYDCFADLSEKILKGTFPYPIKEIAAGMLRYIAYNVNRFDAQRQIQDLLSHGIEPLLEEILKLN